MNVIYKLYLMGSKIVKKYDHPKTPYQRLLESSHLTMGQKEELRRKYQLLNPQDIEDLKLAA